MLTAHKQYATNCYAIPEDGGNLLNKVTDMAQQMLADVTGQS